MAKNENPDADGYPVTSLRVALEDLEKYERSIEK
jgi:hypothetical protein